MYAVFIKPKWADDTAVAVHVCKTSNEAEKYFLAMAGGRSLLEMNKAGVYVDYYQPRGQYLDVAI